MKKYASLLIFALLGLASCGDGSEGVNKESDEVHEGRITTHTKNSHIIHQSLSPEEKELAKDHIKNETAPGVSTTSIDAEGAKIINECRKQK